MLNSLALLHRGTFASEMDGRTRERRPWRNIITNATWHGLLKEKEDLFKKHYFNSFTNYC